MVQDLQYMTSLESLSVTLYRPVSDLILGYQRVTPTEVEEPELAHPICTTDQGPSSGLSTSVGFEVPGWCWESEPRQPERSEGPGAGRRPLFRVFGRSPGCWFGHPFPMGTWNGLESGGGEK